MVRSRKSSVLVVLVFFALVLVVLWFVVPGIVSRKIVQAASDRGFTMTLSSVDLGWSSLTLHDVELSNPALPQMRMTAKTSTILLNGSFEPSEVDFADSTVTIDGDVAAIKQAAPALATSATTTNDALAHVVLRGTGTWTKPWGENTSTTCDSLGVDVLRNTGRKLGDDVALTCARWMVNVSSLNFGPWALAGARDFKGDRFVVHLNADSLASWERSVDHLHQIDVSIVKKKTDELGIPKQALGLVAMTESPTIDLTVHYLEKTPNEATSSLSFTSDRVPFGSGVVLPVTLSFNAQGDPAGVFRVTSSRASLGGFNGSMTGTMDMGKDHADLAFESNVVSCADAAKQVASSTLGDLGAGLANFAHALGADAGVRGSMKMNAEMALDWPPLHITKWASHGTGDCNMSLFP